MKLVKTEMGQLAFRERSPLFTVRQRSVFLLCDGKKDVHQVVAATASMGVTQADVDHLVEQGFLSPAEAATPPIAAASPAAVVQSGVAADGSTDGRNLYVENWTMF